MSLVTRRLASRLGKVSIGIFLFLFVKNIVYLEPFYSICIVLIAEADFRFFVNFFTMFLIFLKYFNN